MSLREDAYKILGAALVAVEPRVAVRRALTLEGETLCVGAEVVDLSGVERVLVVGAGKAAPAMAQGVVDVLGERIAAGSITTKDGHALPVTRVQVLEAAHPVPDARGEQGANAALQLVEGAGEGDLVLCLLSGGASALWPAPVPGMTLSDLQTLTNSLLRAGATIGELNAVRKHLSRISGGRLAQAAAPARIISLVVSDVVGSPPDVIASGPTVPDPTTYTDALAVLARRGVQAPAAVLEHLQAGAAGEHPETPKPGAPEFGGATWHLVASNRQALEGASAEARRLGYVPLLLTTRLEGEAREVARVIAGLAVGVSQDGLPMSPPAALLLGGETTVQVRGDGRGGRNQELALAAALALEGVPDTLIACLGTDGTDGPTDAAGGIVDGGTLARGRQQGLDVREHVDNNDSYPYLQATGDLLTTGPTGTNVNDLVLVLVGDQDVPRR